MEGLELPSLLYSSIWYGIRTIFDPSFSYMVFLPVIVFDCSVLSIIIEVSTASVLFVSNIDSKGKAIAISRSNSLIRFISTLSPKFKMNHNYQESSGQIVSDLSHFVSSSTWIFSNFNTSNWFCFPFLLHCILLPLSLHSFDQLFYPGNMFQVQKAGIGDAYATLLSFQGLS